MDYFQGVVEQYLRADRSCFVNTEFCLQIDDGIAQPAKGSSWYVDLLTVSFAEECVYLCEVSYARRLDALLNRLALWAQDWEGIAAAVRRDAKVPESWPLRPWLFVPEVLVPRLLSAMPPVPEPRITPLEMTVPWKYRDWNRCGEAEKPETIPVKMQ